MTARRDARVVGLLWGAAAIVALGVPARAGMILDGIPLDGMIEAVLVGFVVPVLFVLDRRVFEQRWARMAVIGLLAAKALDAAMLTPSGFCTQFRTDRPVEGPVETIRFEEPSGLMPSWDVRARWLRGGSNCSAFTRRDYPGRAEFPAWFVNLLDNTNPPHSELNLRMSGVLTAAEAGRLTIDTAPAMRATLTVDGALTTSREGQIDATLDAGSHRLELAGRLTGDNWRVVPSWDGRSLWSSVLLTVAEPSSFDLLLWRALPAVSAALALAVIGGWIVATVRRAPVERLTLAAIGISAAISVAAAGIPLLSRFAPLAVALPICAPEVRRHAHTRMAMWVLGVPWLAFVGALAAQHVGVFSHYTRGDDWLVYQISAYRIYLYGYWLEAGETLFYYQPLYRWIAGACHVIFGDSSAGETFWDGLCLLAGALLAFSMTRSVMGGRRALAVGAATLAIFTLTPVWYFLGRGLAEISAAGFAWAAALVLLSARGASAGGARTAIAAGALAVLSFYARLNHMLFVGALLVFLVPVETPAAALRRPAQLRRLVNLRLAIVYLVTLSVGLGLLAARAWYYTGEFSAFAGTSFGLNHTGLGPTTVFSLDVWQKVLHSLFAEMIVGETFDPRGLVVYVGCVAAGLALLQVPPFSRVSLTAAGAVIGALLGALVAHAHGYPGRFSVHLIPLATATFALMTVTPQATRQASASSAVPLASPASAAAQASRAVRP